MNRWMKVAVVRAAYVLAVVERMNRWIKVGVVLAGYVLAVVAAAAAGWLYDWRMAQMPYDTSGGMYAGGQLLTVLGVFFMVALVPTMLGLWFVRRNERLWSVVARLSLGFAGVGLVAMAAFMTASAHRVPSSLMIIELLGLAQFLGVPVWAAAFGVFALLAPNKVARRQLVVAFGIELVIGMCALVRWLSTMSPL